MWTIIGVLIGVLLLVWWYNADLSDAAPDVLEQRAVGLQAGVLAGETATVRWPTWTLAPTNTPRTYPSWTPEPTNTPRVYPSWTPLPSRTPRATPTWTPTGQERPTMTATVIDSTPPPWPTKPCEAPWPFSYAERQTIAAAARNALWLGSREEPQVLPQHDQILSIGLFALDLGAPLTDEYTILADDGGRIRCRGFALGIVALREGAPDTCKACAVVSWGGNQTDR